MTTIYDIDLLRGEVTTLRERVVELEAIVTKQQAISNAAEVGLDVATIAAVLFGDEAGAGQGWAEICTEIRRMQQTINDARDAMDETLGVYRKGCRCLCCQWMEAHPAAPEQAVPIDAGDDPCEQCGQPCDGSRCQDGILASGS